MQLPNSGLRVDEVLNVYVPSAAYVCTAGLVLGTAYGWVAVASELAVLTIYVLLYCLH